MGRQEGDKGNVHTLYLHQSGGCGNVFDPWPFRNGKDRCRRADYVPVHGDYELYRSGNFMPGMVGAIYSFTEKLVASFGATIAAIAVAAIGYTEVMPQLGDDATWAVLWVVEIIVFGLPILGWLANIVAMKFYELDKERMVEIQTEIAEKKKIAKQSMNK